MSNSEVRNSALNYLVKREYYREELKQKLLYKGYHLADIDSVLDQLEWEDKLSNQRYLATYIRAYQRRCYGPQWIYAQLTKKGFDKQAIKRALEDEQVNWQESIRRCYEKRYQSPPADSKESMKVKSYLYRRGYPTDLIAQLFDEHIHSQS